MISPFLARVSSPLVWCTPPVRRNSESAHLLQMSWLLVLSAMYSQVLGYSVYLDELPNGHRVPHPCADSSTVSSSASDSTIWFAVGHLNPRGGGMRNQFGLDFAMNGKVWSPALCMLDSDGDGRHNGLELGDPACVWTPGQKPYNVTEITHPGICDPLDSPICREKNVNALIESTLPCRGQVQLPSSTR